MNLNQIKAHFYSCINWKDENEYENKNQWIRNKKAPNIVFKQNYTQHSTTCLLEKALYCKLLILVMNYLFCICLFKIAWVRCYLYRGSVTKWNILIKLSMSYRNCRIQNKTKPTFLLFPLIHTNTQTHTVFFFFVYFFHIRSLNYRHFWKNYVPKFIIYITPLLYLGMIWNCRKSYHLAKNQYYSEGLFSIAVTNQCYLFLYTSTRHDRVTSSYEPSGTMSSRPTTPVLCVPEFY